MAAGHREIGGVTADVGFESWGADLPEAIEQMTLALAGMMAEGPDRSDTRSFPIDVRADEVGGLIVRYLNEIIFLSETRNFLPTKVERLRVSDGRLKATLVGTTLDPSAHTRGSSIKAATYHGLTVREEPGKVTLRVIFDV